MKKKSTENKIRRAKKKLIAYGYVGRWMNGVLGWGIPDTLHFYDNRKRPARPTKFACGSNLGEPTELCKITIEVIPNKRRRFVR